MAWTFCWNRFHRSPSQKPCHIITRRCSVPRSLDSVHGYSSCRLRIARSFDINASWEHGQRWLSSRAGLQYVPIKTRLKALIALQVPRLGTRYLGFNSQPEAVPEGKTTSDSAIQFAAPCGDPLISGNPVCSWL
jgi:hypothetical protein